MKILIALCLFAVTCQAQTFVRYTIKDWVLQYSYTNSEEIQNGYTNSLCFTVPTNTIFKGTIIHSIYASGALSTQYSDSERMDVGAKMNYGSSAPQTPVLGPATVYLDGNLETHSYTNGTSYPANGQGTIVLLAEFDPVNTTPASGQFAVQPANSSASIGLETSTDLKTWQPTTNGSYGLTNAARFFRMNLMVTP